MYLPWSTSTANSKSILLEKRKEKKKRGKEFSAKKVLMCEKNLEFRRHLFGSSLLFKGQQNKFILSIVPIASYY